MNGETFGFPLARCNRIDLDCFFLRAQRLDRRNPAKPIRIAVGFSRLEETN